MAVPFPYINFFLKSKGCLTCQKCGKKTSALHHDGLCSKCFDFDADRGKRIVIHLTEEQKKAKSAAYLLRKAKRKQYRGKK